MAQFSSVSKIDYGIDAPGVVRGLYLSGSAALQEQTPGLVQTFLLHSSAEPACWHIATVWKDRAALNAMRQTGETPRGVLIFRAAGADPALTIFDVPAYLQPTNFE